ncbi:TetR/AcrR family transcriptional regulator [Oceanobacillus senegalensis]|uniref:TetR/AcrR family transcriptional regulator n=1 Tax=Oceanobacillus senegalensis TaxID=1936063 RepID=UPI000A30F6F7|nr:TetR/AcrR family transcriptional regulator [Oceanobacillus senegalensis]
MVEQLTTPRKERTKEHFQLALIDLIKEKGFHSITVKDIVQHSKYNRSTFYAHYHDKFELAEELLDTMMKGIEKAVEKPYKWNKNIHTVNLSAKSFAFISYIYENRNFFELINYQDSLPNMHTTFPQTILDVYQKKFQFQTINNTPVDMEYFTRYIAYGFYGLLTHWINTDFAVSQEEFIEEVIKLSRTHIETVRYVGE